MKAYATGGFLRDSILGVPARDLDISISGDPLEVGQRVADTFGGNYFALDEEKGLARVLLPGLGVHIDLLPLRGGIEDDLRGRDFTIDAMAAPLRDIPSGSIALIDPTGGMEDLRAGVVRAASEQALVDDPLRLLRGVRLATQLDFKIEPDTADIIQRHAARITSAAAERQRDEVVHILASPRARDGLRLMDALGLFARVLPEMDGTRGTEQPKEHYWDVFNHSIETVGFLDTLLSPVEPADVARARLWRELWQQRDGGEDGEWWPNRRDYLAAEVVPGTPRAAAIKLGGLLHDIGKPATRAPDDTGRIRFFGHTEIGAAMAVRMVGRLRFSAKELSLVGTMVKAHMRPMQMAQQGPPTSRAVYRFFRDCGDAAIDTLLLSLADHLATVGPRLIMEGWRQHVVLVQYILWKRFQEPQVISPPVLLRGGELMEALGLLPGPQVGRLLEMIREAQAAGEVNTKEEALKLARSAIEADQGNH